MAYTLGNIPADAPQWLVNELRKVQEYVSQLENGSVSNTLYAAPKKPREGLTVLADGTTWNPGAGQGVYTYYAAAWHKLG
ncbi:hypothetical protein [Roseateles sp. P5_E11]